MSEELRRTPLYADHVEAGARLVPFAGFEMPVQYSSIKEEHLAVRERAGLFDVSHMGQIHLRGRQAAATLERLVTCEVDSLRPGRARYGLLLHDDGGCIDDVMVTRLADEDFFVCVNASNVDVCWTWIASHLNEDGRNAENGTLRVEGNGVIAENRSDETALLALQGPAARGLLEAITAPETPLPQRFRVAPCEIAGIEVLASGTGYTGSPGFELYVEAISASSLWKALLTAGQDGVLLPAGLGARDTLRLEAALPLYGHELDRSTTPFEAGLDRFVKPLDRGFIGAQALADRNAEAACGDPKRLVGFEMVGRGIARAEYPILRDGETIGVVTSGAPSPSLGKSIGLGYVPRSASAPGSRLDIEIRGKTIEARIVETPFLERTGF